MDEYFMQIAELVKKRSGCNRRQVGAVFVLDKRIISTGYNQAPSSIRHCNKEGAFGAKGCTIVNGHCVRSIHAEVNGILNAVRSGQTLLNSTLYCTCEPCTGCLKLLRNAGIKKIVYREDYPLDKAEEDLHEELKILFSWSKYAE